MPLTVDPAEKPDQDECPEPKKRRATDATLVVASRIDRTLAEIPDYGREMILRYLCKKYGVTL